MITGPDNLFATPEVEALLREELVRVTTAAARQPAGRALIVQACAANRELPLETRHLSNVRMHADEGRWRGDVVCAPDLLPWEDEAFQLIVAQHVGDVGAIPDAMLDEFARVLAPGGNLLWFGLNPWSPWMVWLHWRARRDLPLPRATHADALRRRLSQARLSPGHAEAIGSCWPEREAHNGERGMPMLAPLRGAWLLAAAKQRAVLTPLRRRVPRGRVAVHPSLAAPSRRVRA